MDRTLHIEPETSEAIFAGRSNRRYINIIRREKCPLSWSSAPSQDNFDRLGQKYPTKPETHRFLQQGETDMQKSFGPDSITPWNHFASAAQAGVQLQILLTSQLLLGVFFTTRYELASAILPQIGNDGGARR